MPFDVLCPKCHRLFTKELEEKEFFNHDFAQVPGDNPSMRGSSGWQPYYVRKEFSRYRYHYKCKHCGYEWTEIKTVESDA